MIQIFVSSCVFKKQNYDFRKIISYYYRFIIYKLYYHLVQKEKAYKKGYNKAENDVLHEIYNSATWLGTLPNKTSYNTLWLFREIYRAKGHVNADRFRQNLLQLDETKRITDLQSSIIERLLM